jgi:hypothetical protein
LLLFKTGKRLSPSFLKFYMKKTLVLGATPNPERYAYLAVQRLHAKGHEVVPVGIREGQIEGISILQGEPLVPDVDTISLYVGPERQKDYYDYMLSLKPRRIIFNPGTENPEFENMAQAQQIEVVEGCTLVMLSIGAF